MSDCSLQPVAARSLASSGRLGGSTPAAASAWCWLRAQAGKQVRVRRPDNLLAEFAQGDPVRVRQAVGGSHSDQQRLTAEDLAYDAVDLGHQTAGDGDVDGGVSDGGGKGWKLQTTDVQVDTGQRQRGTVL